MLQSNPSLISLIGGSKDGNQLATEVEILESPSVLKPVFEFVKEKKQERGVNVSNWRYTNWVKNLKIELVKGTTVLELAYRDTDKDLVLPVIHRISETYQAYSGRDRERGIKKGLQYLNQQIDIYNNKSISSLRKAQEYAAKYDLSILQGDGENDGEIKNSLNIELIRVDAARKIKNLNQQLKTAESDGRQSRKTHVCWP